MLSDDNRMSFEEAEENLNPGHGLLWRLPTASRFESARADFLDEVLEAGLEPSSLGRAPVTVHLGRVNGHDLSRVDRNTRFAFEELEANVGAQIQMLLRQVEVLGTVTQPKRSGSVGDHGVYDVDVDAANVLSPFELVAKVGTCSNKKCKALCCETVPS